MILGHWLYAVLGLSGSGPVYAFVSGAGSDLGELAILAVVWRHLTCGVTGCHRLGLHPVHGTAHRTCRTHHPTRGNTAESIHADQQGSPR